MAYLDNFWQRILGPLDWQQECVSLGQTDRMDRVSDTIIIFSSNKNVTETGNRQNCVKHPSMVSERSLIDIRHQRSKLAQHNPLRFSSRRPPIPELRKDPNSKFFQCETLKAIPRASPQPPSGYTEFTLRRAT